MKNAIALILAAILLCGCSANPRCESEAVLQALSEAETVSCTVFEENGSFAAYEISAELIAPMLEGEWEKISRPAEFERVVSVTVSTQYEIGFFEGGTAIVYSGYAGVAEKDRQYYSVSLETELQELCSFVRENGAEISLEDN